LRDQALTFHQRSAQLSFGRAIAQRQVDLNANANVIELITEQVLQRLIKATN
jgi:hypothetical protein